jgi:hypothetical protein
MTKLPSGQPAAASGSERRARHRIPAECNALVRLSDALTFRCTLRNVSAEAAQVVCDARYALLLRSAEGLPQPGPQPLEISIALPLNGTVRGFTAFCVARYRAPLGDDRMLLGLQFRDLERSARALLDDFLALRGG